MLSEITHLAITVDVWIDRRAKAFIGVTSHFIDVNHILQALLLDLMRLKGSRLNIDAFNTIVFFLALNS